MNLPGGAPPENDEVRWTADAIVDRSAECVTSIVTGVAAHALGATLPAAVSGVHGVLNSGLVLIREADAESVIEDAVDVANGRVSKLVGMGLRHASALLRKVADGQLPGAVERAIELLDEWAGKAVTVSSIAGDLMAHLYNENDVVQRSSALILALEGHHQRQRERQLRKLRNSNERWVKPVKYLAHGLGPLWLVSLPVPVAPIAAGLMLAWVILISGDQLDAHGPFPDFWKGVLRRSDGE